MENKDIYQKIHNGDYKPPTQSTQAQERECEERFKKDALEHVGLTKHTKSEKAFELARSMFPNDYIELMHTLSEYAYIILEPKMYPLSIKDLVQIHGGDFAERIEKIRNISYDSALKLIYEWVKTGVVTLKQFKILIEENRTAL